MSKQFAVVGGELFISQKLVAEALAVADLDSVAELGVEVGQVSSAITTEALAQVSADEALASRIGAVQLFDAGVLSLPDGWTEKAQAGLEDFRKRLARIEEALKLNPPD